MIYGITVELISRPCLKPLMPIHKFTFRYTQYLILIPKPKMDFSSLLGSLSFNYSSLLCFHWIFNHLEDSPVIRTFLGYMAGRILMVHLLAFLYHIDTRCTDPGERPRRISAFEVMYSWFKNKSVEINSERIPANLLLFLTNDTVTGET